jgi:ATP-binding protein involved in chromosome partitioning
VFGEGGGAEIRDDYDVPVLAELPVHPDFDSGDMAGPTIREEDSEVRQDLFDMVDATADRIGEVNRRRVAEHVGLDGQESVPGGESESTTEGSDDADAEAPDSTAD